MGKPPAAAPGAIPWRGKLPLQTAPKSEAHGSAAQPRPVSTGAMRCSSVGGTIGGRRTLVKWSCEVICSTLYFTCSLSPVRAGKHGRNGQVLRDSDGFVATATHRNRH